MNKACDFQLKKGIIEEAAALGTELKRMRPVIAMKEWLSKYTIIKIERNQRHKNSIHDKAYSYVRYIEYIMFLIF